MRLPRLLYYTLPTLLAFVALPALADSPVKTFYSLSLLGEPKYPADFKHFDYVNPDAPKGGELKRAAIGSFDSFNPFIVKGQPAAGTTLLFETLLAPSEDEADASYGLLAQSIELPDDHSWVAYNLRPEARFQDGTPVTAADVVFSFNMLTTKGDPQYALYYADVAKAEAVGPLKVKFTFKTTANRELPVILGQLNVLPEHYWKGKAFDEFDADPAARQRALQGRFLRSRPLRHLSPRSQLLGCQAAGQYRPQQFRDAALRLLQGSQHRAHRLPRRRLRHHGRIQRQELGHPV